jgi:REP element-mobilizing transposase RayT
MPHSLRAPLASRFPVHVTLRTVDGLSTLRSRACFGAIDSAFKLARRRQTVRLLEFSAQGNHLHLVVEAADAMRLARGMRASASASPSASTRCLWRRPRPGC